MIVGSISENKEIEKRVSITPDIVKKYISQGFKVLVERDYGVHLGISNDVYEKEGCKFENKENILKKSDIILQLNLPDEKSFEIIDDNKLLIGAFNSNQNKEKLNNIKKK